MMQMEGANVRGGVWTLEDAVTEAATAKYGNRVLGAWPFSLQEQTNFENNLYYEMREMKDPEQEMRFIVGLHAKEHFNQGTQPDVIKIKTTKANDRVEGSGFKFFLLSGIQFNNSGNVACTIPASDVKQREEDAVADKIVVPPGCKINATIKQCRIRYHGNASTRIRALTGTQIKIRYRKTKCCTCCCCTTTCVGYLSAEELFSTQPTFQREGNGFVSYGALYLYQYIGEQNEVKKVEEKLPEPTHILPNPTVT